MYTAQLNHDKILSKLGPKAIFSIMVAKKRVTVGGISLTDNEFFQMSPNELSDLQAAVDHGFVVFKNEGVIVKNVAEAEDTTIRAIGSGMLGDITMEISPATIDKAATADAWKRSVNIELKDSNGNLHGWLSSTFAGVVSIADTSIAGTASIASADLVVDKGRATVEVDGDAADWLAAETDTLTIGDLTVMDSVVSGGASVQTFV